MATQLKEQNKQLLLTKNIVNGYKITNQLAAVQEKFSRFIVHESMFGSEVAKYLEHLPKNTEFEITDEFSFDFIRLVETNDDLGSVIFFNERGYNKFLKEVKKTNVVNFIDLSSAESAHPSIINELIKMGLTLEDVKSILRFVDDTIDVINSDFFGIHSISFFNNNRPNFFSDTLSLDQKVKEIIPQLGEILASYEQYAVVYIAPFYQIKDTIGFAAKIIGQIRYYLCNLHPDFVSLLSPDENYPFVQFKITNEYPWNKEQPFASTEEMLAHQKKFSGKRKAPSVALEELMRYKASVEADVGKSIPTLESWMKQLQAEMLEEDTEIATTENNSASGLWGYGEDIVSSDEDEDELLSEWMERFKAECFESTVTPSTVNALSQLNLVSNMNVTESPNQEQAKDQAPSGPQT